VSSQEENTAVTDVTKAMPRVFANECLVVIYQRGGVAGRCFRFEKTPIRIGRAPDNEIVLDDDDGVSRWHVRLERRGDGLMLMDLGSTNGTLLNDNELVGVAELQNGDRFKVGATIFKYLQGTDIEAALHEQIYANTITDNLTQLFNKRHFEDELAREFSRSRRHDRPLGLMVIDIDHFKRVNDTYGHHLGDIALKAVADAIRSALRSGDIVARFGGEEIAVLLPETDLRRSVAAAEKVREAVAAHVIRFRNTQLQVTVSIGCAEFSETDTDARRFFERCDRKVYVAKDAGRNCVRW
jgi:diguanylate cyclase (GGDEF)-like protein